MIAGFERSPGEVNGNQLQYSYLGNPMDREVWQVTVQGVARVGQNLATKIPPPKTDLGPIAAAAAARSLQSCPTLCDPKTVACQTSLSMGFPKQEYCSG